MNEKANNVSIKTNKSKADKSTTLTIVQEFPKKKADQEKERAPQAIEMINH